jgi:hypothetical protein
MKLLESSITQPAMRDKWDFGPVTSAATTSTLVTYVHAKASRIDPKKQTDDRSAPAALS